jgi:hypothetical protein
MTSSSDVSYPTDGEDASDPTMISAGLAAPAKGGNIHPTDDDDSLDPTMISAGYAHKSEDGGTTSTPPNDDKGLSPEEINSVMQAE